MTMYSHHAGSREHSYSVSYPVFGPQCTDQSSIYVQILENSRSTFPRSQGQCYQVCAYRRCAYYIIHGSYNCSTSQN